MTRLRFAVGLPLLVAALAFWPARRHGIVIYAQTLPVTLHAQWTPNPTSENVTAYQLTLDTATPQTIAPTVCTATLCDTPLVVTTFGAHTVSLTAQNLEVSTDPASIQVSLAATLSFTLVQQAGRPGGLGIKK